MAKPPLPFEKFVLVWEELAQVGTPTIAAALQQLGGSKSTLIAYRERYEKEKNSKQMTLLRNIKLPEAILRGLAEIKVQEVDILEEANTKLRSRLDENFIALRKTEEAHAATLVEWDEAKHQWENEKLKFERQLAASQALLEEKGQREKRLLAEFEKVRENYQQAKQEAAVAKKEIELLREKAKKG